MIDTIIENMGISKDSQNIQRVQTEHRLKLIEFWNIKKGSRILEIGCGQGDTLAALACVAGERGFVHGVDIADENYGAPETLGQARERLMKSKLGNNIRMDFGFEVTGSSTSFAENEFDYIVLSHCIWYLSDYHSLTDILRCVKPWGKKLCLAEWNPCIDYPNQLPHLRAVTIQAVWESFQKSSFFNVRTLFYPQEIAEAVCQSGWHIDKTGTIYSPDMQDGTWEVHAAADLYKNRISCNPKIPEKLKHLLLTQIEEIRHAKQILPLSAYCLSGVK